MAVVKGTPLAKTLVGGVTSAILFLSVTILPNFGTALLSSLAPIPLFMVGLSLGKRPVITASLITCALTFLLAHPIHGLSFLLLYAIPLVLLTDRALLNRKVNNHKEWYPASFLLMWLFGLTVTIVTVAVLMIAPYNDPELLRESLQQLGPLLGPQPEGAIESLGNILPFFPAFFGFSWCFSMIINGALAQGILTGFKANLRPSPQLTSLQLPRWFLSLTAIVFIIALLNLSLISQLAANISPLCLIPFSLVGLGYAHSKISQTPSPQFFFIAFYAILIVFLWPLLLLALIGIVLTFTNKK